MGDSTGEMDGTHSGSISLADDTGNESKRPLDGHDRLGHIVHWREITLLLLSSVLAPYPCNKTHETDPLPHVLRFETEDVLLQRNQPELILVYLDRPEDAQLLERVSADDHHPRDHEKVEDVRLGLCRLDLF